MSFVLLLLLMLLLLLARAWGAAAIAAASATYYSRGGYWCIVGVCNRQKVAVVAAQCFAQDCVVEISGEGEGRGGTTFSFRRESTGMGRGGKKGSQMCVLCVLFVFILATVP